MVGTTGGLSAPASATAGHKPAAAPSVFSERSPMELMKLPTEVFEDVAVVHSPEQFGENEVESVELYIGQLKQKKVVLDLDNTEMIDSQGLTSLLDMQDRLRQSGGALKIAATNPSNHKILEITRLDLQLEVFDSVIDAVRSFR